jgi:hypothetical protein
VGKTESAKALARYLYGDASRLLRFDMNEFVSPRAVARLVGTFDQPDGLLSRAVRREPFSVVLLDEIEKGHPQVFDLLLQILGEARLTDAVGRTVDFSNVIVVLTSNLGTRQAAHGIGFGDRQGDDPTGYLRAVRDFFRPEFFNRLDRIVPFSRLDREAMARIARRVIEEVTGREGLLRRRCALEVSEEAMRWVIERGYHPLLGARALKRAVEGTIVAPLAEQLARFTPETPTVLLVSRRGEGLAVRVVPLVDAPRLAGAERPAIEGDPQAWLERIRAALARIEKQCARYGGDYDGSSGQFSPKDSGRWSTQDALKQVRREVAELADSLTRRGRQQASISEGRFASLKAGKVIDYVRHPRLNPQRQLMREICAVQDIHQFVKDLGASPTTQATRDASVQALHRLLEQLALLEAMTPGERGWTWDRALLLVRSLSDAPQAVRNLRRHFQRSLCLGASNTTARKEADTELGLHAKEFPWPEAIADPSLRAARRAEFHLEALECEGHHIERFAQLHEGTHLVVCDDGKILPLQAVVLPLADGHDAGDAIVACLETHRAAVAEGRLGEGSDPFRWQPVVGLYDQRGGLIADLRTGLRAPRGGNLPPAAALLAALPLPPEVRE